MVVPNGANSFPGLVYRDARAEKAVGIRMKMAVLLLLGDQTQKQVLGKHHVSAKSSGFSLGKDDGFDCSLRKPLEDGGDDPELDFSPGGGAGGKGASFEGGEERRSKMW